MPRLLYFGRLTDLTGKTEESIDLPDEIETALHLRSWLDKRYSAEGALLEPTIRVALDNQISLDSDLLNGAEEIAIMPPVGGG